MEKRLNHLVHWIRACPFLVLQDVPYPPWPCPGIRTSKHGGVQPRFKLAEAGRTAVKTGWFPCAFLSLSPSNVGLFLGKALTEITQIFRDITNLLVTRGRAVPSGDSLLPWPDLNYFLPFTAWLIMAVCMHGCECMDAWVHECTNTWMGECVNVWMYECMMYRCIRAHARVCVYVWTCRYVHLYLRVRIPYMHVLNVCVCIPMYCKNMICA